MTQAFTKIYTSYFLLIFVKAWAFKQIFSVWYSIKKFLKMTNPETPGLFSEIHKKNICTNI